MQATTDSVSKSEKSVELTGNALTVEEVVSVAREDARVSVSEEALQRMRQARSVVERVLARGTPVYGTNTGLGSLLRHQIPLEELERFSFATVADQTASYGQPLATDIVRAMMVARANGMAKAGVGVRRELVLHLVEALNAGVHPVVRRLGSVGQGDLSEMSDIGKVMIGRGLAEVGGRVLPGDQALAAVGLEPISPAPKEALALVSSNGVTLGHGSLVLVDAVDLTESVQIAAALSLEGFAGNLSPIHPAAARMRPHAGEIKASTRLRELLTGSYLWEPGAARNLQDPLSFRCVAQTHGALNDALSFTRGEMDVELNSASDNPLVVVEDEAIISVGSFDVVALAIAFDLLRLGMASAHKVADERVQKLLWNAFSGLPTGLAPRDGPTGGLRPLGRWCAALAAEASHLANPVSLAHGAQLAEGVEDHASMAPLSVRKTSELVSLGHRMVAHELICAAQAIDLRRCGPLGEGTRVAYESVRECVPRLVDEAAWEPDIARLVERIANGELAARVAADAGEREPLEAHEGPGVATPESGGRSEAP
jgi:histidine ammonia-lyase